MNKYHSVNISPQIIVFFESHDDINFKIIEMDRHTLEIVTIGNIRLEEDGEYSSATVAGNNNGCVASGKTPEQCLERFACLYYDTGDCDLCKKLEEEHGS